ncbi:MAG: rcc01693 family protein [Paracoccaceae bacterium]
MSGVDWDALMRAGLGALRLAPEAFWSMTPKELARALEGAGLAGSPGRAPARDALDAMMARYPDVGTGSQGRSDAGR